MKIDNDMSKQVSEWNRVLWNANLFLSGLARLNFSV